MHFTRTVIALLALVIPSPAFADVSYTLSPLVIDEEVEQRDIIEKNITLTNQGDTPVTIYPTVNNISLDEGGGIEEFVTQVMSDQTTSLAAWIEISRAGIDLMAGDTKVVPLTLRINPGAKSGTYHAYLGFAYGGNRDEAERKVAQGTAPGIIVTATLVEKKTTLLKLAQFFVDRFVVSSENTASSFTVRNPGDEPLIPVGEVIVYDTRGREMTAVPINPERLEILPGEEHIFKGTIPIDGLFGKYKAFLSVEYGTANLASVQDTTFFYAVPLRILLGILGALLVVVTASALYIHKKYLDESVNDGTEHLSFHVRNTQRDPLHHDINLKS